MPIYIGENDEVMMPGVSAMYFGTHKIYAKKNPLCFTATVAGSTIGYSLVGITADIQCSTDGKNWTAWDSGTVKTLTDVGDTLYVRNTKDTLSISETENMSFSMSGGIAASGDVRSMINYKSLSAYCFCGLFSDCTSLTAPPELPSTALAEGCYSYMFEGCTALTKAPELPATVLTTQCYYQMFDGCTSLESVPTLSVTALADECCNGMFQNCSSLWIDTTGTLLFTCPDTTGLTDPVKDMFNGANEGMYSTDPVSGTSYYSQPIPLKFTANTAGSTVKYTLNSTSSTVVTSGISYSTDGMTWTVWSKDTAVTLTNVNDKIYVKNSNSTLSTGSSNYLYFVMTGSIAANGDISSLINNSVLSDYCYYYLFKNCSALTTAPELPATVLASSCYYGMFYGCKGLTSAPELPATILANDCYREMFAYCSSLITVPELPVRTLTTRCYQYMFQSCTKLTTPPELPATTMAISCYCGMFCGCTKLTTAPSLPATTLASGCYLNIFNGCTSLVNAPTLPATTMAYDCYDNMFNGCTALVNAPALPATTLASQCYSQMFYNCTSLTSAPELPATALQSSCYYRMFYGCTSLVNAPELPSMTLASSCYSGMFNGCVSLVNAPELPATTLASQCYYNMFYNCSSLVKAPSLSATILASSCYDSMFYKCTSLTKAPELPATALQSSCYYRMFYGCVSLNVNVSEGISFFTCPSSIPTNAVSDMFTDTGGTFKGTPTAGTSYYYTYVPLTFTADTSGSTVKYTVTGTVDTTGIQYSTDNSVWNAWDGSTLTLANVGDKVYIRNTNDTLSTSSLNYFQFVMTGDISASGNVDSMIDYADLSNYCYYRMFRECTSLTSAPELPSMTLATYCYASMFAACTSLKSAPQLPATTLAIRCYDSMFEGCSSMECPMLELPATDLSYEGCYYHMFYWCSSLTYPPVIKGVPSSANCCNAMFYLTGIKVETTGMPFFTTSSDIPTYAVSGMFSSTQGSITSDPVANTTYYCNNALCFTANTAGSTVKYTVTGTVDTTGIQYSTDGVSWNTWGGAAITLAAVGDKLYVRNSNNTLSTSSSNYLKFGITAGSIAASGNVNSMINNSALSNYCYYQMFCQCSKLTSAPKLPSTVLKEGCYYNMFYNCTSLTSAPELPATVLASSCYKWMFYNCTSLTSAPKLPAMALVSDCYASMFYNCTSLTSAPKLPAMVLAYECYQQMFYGCTSLTTAPSLPATALQQYCYSEMFRRCTSLTTAPELPATTLQRNCYNQMFYDCTALKISDSSGTSFFTCPSTIPTYAVRYMFSGTGGTYTSDPVANGTYYYYT